MYTRHLLICIYIYIFDEKISLRINIVALCIGSLRMALFKERENVQEILFFCENFYAFSRSILRNIITFNLSL